MRYPWVNIALLALLLLQAVSGYLGFVNGEARRAWLLWLHGMGAYALALLLWWKGAVVWGVLRRGQAWSWARVSFLAAAALLLLTLALGLLWTFGGRRYLWGFSLVSLHIYTAVPLMLLVAFHSWRMRWIVRVRRATDRRAFLRLALAGVAGALLWAPARLLQQPRRFTGSYEVGSMGGWFPRVSWINDNPAPLDAAAWTLAVGGAVPQPYTLDYEALLQLAGSERVATLDCTGGWYSQQVWRGAPLAELLALAGGVQPDARSVLVRSVTGYGRRFSLDEADSAGLLLATHVAGAPLEHGHGFPARLVVPHLRGFEWVKWVVEIRVERAPAWLQPPLPLQ